MKLLYVHDHRYISFSGSVYSEAQFGSIYWSRYLDIFSKITVIGRQSEIPEGKQASDLEISSLPEVSFALLPNLSGIFSQIFLRHTVSRQILEYLKSSDALIARLPSELGLLAISLAKKLGKPWAVEMVACPWDSLWNYGSLKGKLYAPVMSARTRSALRDAPFSLYVTNEFLQSRYPCRSGQTTACSNVDIPDPSRDVLKMRLDRINSRSGPVVLGLIGTLRTRYKGIQLVLSALSAYRGRLPDVRFRILGPGDPSPWLEEARRYGISDLVIFDGALPSGDTVLNWLDGIDIYLQPSLQEGLPRALIEAMSRGCPALGSTVAGIPELLDEADMVKPADVGELGAMLCKRVLDTDWQLRTATRNWSVASGYSNRVLGERRRLFWQEFANYAAGVN